MKEFEEAIFLITYEKYQAYIILFCFFYFIQSFIIMQLEREDSLIHYMLKMTSFSLSIYIYKFIHNL